MPANRQRILLHGGESRLKKFGGPAARQDAFRPATPRLTICSSLAILMSSWSQHHSLLSARHRSMSSFIYVLVFVTCSTVYHGCLTTTSNQTFASRQECLEAAGLMVGVQSATCKPRRVFVQ